MAGVRSQASSVTGSAVARARSSTSRSMARMVAAGEKISVFTTRIDTIYGATSVQLAPENPHRYRPHRQRSRVAREGRRDLIAEQRNAKEKGDIGSIDKHGVDTRRFAINPFNGEKVPIWVANYILMDYGTGAIMSVPAHDDRDYEFAKKYGIDTRVVILPRREQEPPESGQPEEPVLPFTAEDSILINSGEWTGSPPSMHSRKWRPTPSSTASGKRPSRIALRIGASPASVTGEHRSR